MSLKHEDDLDALREQWNELYRKRLPALAKAKDPAQPKWPVVLDHCFARIILDNAVGVDRPWADAVKAPATKNMSGSQLKAALKLGDDLATGVADLVRLDERSLLLRGKKSKMASGGVEGSGRKRDRDREDGKISKYFAPSPESPRKRTKTEPTDEKDAHVSRSVGGENPDDDEIKDETSAVSKAQPTVDSDVDISPELSKIANSNLTAFRKQTLTLLCQVPRGRYSTYQAMSDHITATSHKTCARAVGNAMRNNPFAPEVPCHRILAADGSLGGFGGHWGESGKFANKKHELLRAEGVRFDGRGKVVGRPFRDFNKTAR